MRKRRSVLQCWLLFIGVTLLAAAVLLTAIYIKMRPLVYIAARSQAETVMLNAASHSMLRILQENNIGYNDISKISKDSDGNVNGVEIDIKNIALLKNSISSAIPNEIAKNEFYDVFIPLGTLTGLEITANMGPMIKIPMQLTSTVIVDYENKFITSGINNTLHQILINIELKCNIIMFGFSKGFSVSTTEIAAQTVIVGVTPDTFTCVTETPRDDIADDLFNYAN